MDVQLRKPATEAETKAKRLRPYFQIRYQVCKWKECVYMWMQTCMLIAWMALVVVQMLYTKPCIIYDKASPVEIHSRVPRSEIKANKKATEDTV